MYVFWSDFQRTSHDSIQGSQGAVPGNLTIACEHEAVRIHNRFITYAFTGIWKVISDFVMCNNSVSKRTAVLSLKVAAAGFLVYIILTFLTSLWHWYCPGLLAKSGRGLPCWFTILSLLENSRETVCSWQETAPLQALVSCYIKY